GDGPVKDRRRGAMTKLARRRIAPGLLAYEDGEPVGWVAVGPRQNYVRVDTSRATPRVDDQEVWIIPCVTVSKTARGRGIAVVLIKAAVDYAIAQGAPAVEAYPRASDRRTGDDNVYFGTEPLFRRAGFETIRGPLPDRPKNWLPRLAMRFSG
ncbi:MAG: GNAT family N-acetyltransferase, partial [Hyphomicrobiaceae bacterium]